MIKVNNIEMKSIKVNNVAMDKVIVNGVTVFTSLPAVFADATWAQIRTAARSGSIPASWAIGDTKPITLTNGAQHDIRICDKQIGRYPLFDGSGSSNLVLEFQNVVLINTPMRSPVSNSGGWGGSNLKNTTLPTIWNTLPIDLKSAISPVNVKSSNGYYSRPATFSNDNNLFCPSEYEIFGTTTYSIGSSEGSPTYDYYRINNTAAARVKGTPYPFQNWWLRSPSLSNEYYFCLVDAGGYIYEASSTNLNGVAVFFAI